MRKLLALFFLACLALVLLANTPSSTITAGLPAPAAAAMNQIDSERIRAHVKFLSSDLLEGRGTGQRGSDIAADYIATQFSLLGLKPAGDNGSYMQKVPLVGILTDGAQTSFEFVPQSGAPMSLKYADDYVAGDQTQVPTTDVDADVVFVGYGIDAPEYKWNDFKGTDVKGKILLMLVNEPASDDPKFFKGPALTYYGRWTYKFEEGARLGAAGVVLIHKTDMASYGWDVVRNSFTNEQSYLVNDEPKLKVASWIQLDVARKLFFASGKDLDQMLQAATSRDFKPVPLPIKLRAHMVSKVRKFDSQNVLAVLPGSDPKLKSQAVIYSAHYDHLGIDPSKPGDNIYNGAMDNATGCGILLEIARAFAHSQAKPKRSILFAAVTAEEKGLLGSEYLGQHLPFPAADISLGLNYDDVRALGDPEELEVSGAERTTALPLVEETAKQFHLTIRPDAAPGAGHYYRSDHFSFARVGVPAFSVNEGRKFKGHTEGWGDQQYAEYTAKHYHQPSDEYSPDQDYTGDAVMARYGFALGWKAAELPTLIQWQPGDEFEKARKASASGSH